MYNDVSQRRSVLLYGLGASLSGTREKQVCVAGQTASLGVQAESLAHS